MKVLHTALGVIALVGMSPAAFANNVGENYAWQFQTSTDKANAAIIQDMIQKKKSGYYAPPTYVTNIDKQYNCSVSATATGNEGTNTNLANSPSTSGSTATSTGNENTTDADGYHGGSTVDTGQDNSGSVGSSVHGSNHVDVDGSPQQALNSTQTNSGDQTATVDGSTACHFANVLN